jgi:glycosyltransferase involved in cell wall biosynthesis
MKVLIDHPLPFALAHGGLQVQIEQTKLGLEKAGVEVEYLRWWDDIQQGDIIHYFGRPGAFYIDFAHRKGIRVVLAELLTGLGSRPPLARLAQRSLIRAASAFLPEFFTARMAWDAYRIADACVALTPWEAQLMHEMFGAPKERVQVIPNGVEDVFLSAPEAERGRWLICTATITPRKRVLELGEAALKARTPLWVIGAPYGENDSYGRRFIELARDNPETLRYEGAIRDRERLAQIYREARGFVLLSTMESLSLSALEAAACECPLLLTDLPWARTSFGANASYCPVTSMAGTADILRRFYDQAPTLPIASRPLNWSQVAERLQHVYATLPALPSTSS